MCMKNKSTNTRMHVKSKIKKKKMKHNEEKEELKNWGREREKAATAAVTKQNKQSTNFVSKTVCSSLIITLFYSVILIFYGERFIIIIHSVSSCYTHLSLSFSLIFWMPFFFTINFPLETRNTTRLSIIFNFRHYTRTDYHISQM